MKNNVLKILTIGFVFYVLGVFFEMTWDRINVFFGACPARDSFNLSIMGYIWAFAAVLAGYTNELFPKLHVWLIYLIMCVPILVVEVVTFYALRAFDIEIWNYANVWGNFFDGAICIPFAVIWLFLMPLCAWLDDWLRIKITGGEIIGISNYYKGFGIAEYRKKIKKGDEK